MKTEKIEIFRMLNQGWAHVDALYDIVTSDEQSKKRPAVIVCPGGAYAYTSEREAEPVAMEFVARGYNAFVLRYSCGESARYPLQLNELAFTVDYVKRRADDLGVDKDRVYVVGFSAGGHLTANLACEWSNLACDCKPTAIALGYPVISTEYGYYGSHDNLLRGYSDEQKNILLDKLNLDNSVNPMNPPTFVWTTCADNAVPCANSIMYVNALAKVGVKCEFHMYPDGGHGLSTATTQVNEPADYLKKIHSWIDFCVEFFDNIK